MRVSTKGPTRQMLLKALKGKRIEYIEFEAETVEVPSEDGIYRKFEHTGRKFLRLTLVPRKVGVTP